MGDNAGGSLLVWVSCAGMVAAPGAVMVLIDVSCGWKVEVEWKETHIDEFLVLVETCNVEDDSRVERDSRAGGGSTPPINLALVIVGG
eukprot:scaffold2933_cov85-Cylindrotheca_fusiformis.AAC.1